MHAWQTSSSHALQENTASVCAGTCLPQTSHARVSVHTVDTSACLFEHVGAAGAAPAAAGAAAAVATAAAGLGAAAAAAARRSKAWMRFSVPFTLNELPPLNPVALEEELLL
eukprot:2205301-Rhodomonas_salina.1